MNIFLTLTAQAIASVVLTGIALQFVLTVLDRILS
jgi:hypothetical protein